MRLLLIDTAVWALSFYAAHWLRFRSGVFPPAPEQIAFSEYLPLLAITLPVLWLAQGLAGMYRGRLDQEFSRQWGAVLTGWAWAMLGLLGFSFFLRGIPGAELPLLRRGLPESRLTFLLIALLSFVLVSLARYLYYRLTRRVKSIYLVGEPDQRELVAGRLSELPGGKFEIAGEGEELPEPEDLPEGCSTIAWCGPVPEQGVLELEELALESGVEVLLLPGAETLASGVLNQTELAGLPALRPATETDLAAMERIKRVEDLVIGGLTLLLASPLLLLGMALVRLTSPGPVFFRHRRVGRHGEPFEVVKLRTMYQDAELPEDLRDEFEEDYKLDDDPRVTAVGKWLRLLSIDEIPQLFNVIRGDMGLVGPRPIVRDELDKYGDWTDVLTAVRPGLTGLWQVSGRSALDYRERVELDIYYIQNWSVWMDLAIILRTPGSLLRTSETS